MIQTTETTPRFETSPREEVIIVETEGAPALHATRKTWWSAILAGAVTAMAMQAVFAVLGTAIGMSVVSASTDAPDRGIGIGAGLWWLVTGLVSLFVGGWVAGHKTPTVERSAGAMHGFLTWCTITVVSALLVAMAGGALLGGGLSAVSNLARNDSNRLAPRDSATLARGQRDTLRNPALDNQAATPTAANEPDATARSIKQEARDIANDPDARRAADEAAKKTAATSWWTFFALILGAGVTALGGSTGANASIDMDRKRRHATA